MVKKATNKNSLELLNLQSEVADLTEKYKRALADYQNQERRFREAESATIKFANSALIARLLPIIDHLELAQSHLNDAGLQMVLDGFSKLLVEEGVEIVNPVGEDFDPQTMECTDTNPTEPLNQVVSVMSKGYRYNSRVLRPSQVVVGSRPESQQS